MGIKNTLNVKPGVLSQTGNMQMQPHPVSIEFDTSTNSILQPALSNLTNVTTINPNGTNGNIEVTNGGSSISSIIGSFKPGGSSIIVPNSGLSSNRITNSYSGFDLSSIISPDKDFNVNFREFKPADILSGISSERPEIIMLTQFKPLFHKSFDSVLSLNDYTEFMTDAGLYCDAQIKSRHLKLTNTKILLRTLSTNNHILLGALKQKTSDLQVHINSLKTIYGFLLTLLRKMHLIQEHLDVRHTVHNVDPQETIRVHLLNYSHSTLSFLSSPLISNARNFMPLKYNIVDMLVKLGYNRSNVQNKFTSTKIWMQLLLEYKNILENHSLQFLDTEPTTQKNDNNAINLTTPDVPYFKVTDNLLKDLLSINQISSTAANSLKSAESIIQNAFLSIYDRGAHFKSPEARIAALLHLFSREYKYSVALNKQNVKQVLNEKYSYNTSTTSNTTVFESIIGNHRKNVLDFPRSESNSLLGVSQRLPSSDVAILTFESDYIEGINATYTPGAEYYVNNSISENNSNFDVSRAKELSTLMRVSHKSFSTVVDSFNLLSSTEQDPRRRTQTESIISHSTSLARLILEPFIDRNTGVTKSTLANDKLGSIYSLAASNVALKSLLFLYTISKVTRAYSITLTNFAAPVLADNTPLSDAIINKIVPALLNATKAKPGFKAKGNATTKVLDLYPEIINAGFKSGTPLTREIEKLMSLFLDTLNKHGGLSNSRTRYSGLLDTTIMMVMFDAILSTIARVSNLSITGYQTSPVDNGIVFLVDSTTINHKTQVIELQQRLDAETALTQQLTYTVLSILNSVGASADSYTSYVNSNESKQNLKAMSDIVDDKQKLRLLFLEQQASLFSSTVQDVISNLSLANKNSGVDVDNNEVFDVNDEIKLIDDVATSSKVKNALLSALGTHDYTSSKAFNKKILTVGIPIGFSSKLKKHLTLSDLSNLDRDNKQRDIIKVCVYKLDMLNQDIIYKPKKFLFELSRFVVRADAQIKNIGLGSNISEIAAAIPTRDFAEANEEGSSAISYWNPSQESSPNKSNSMSSKSYDFLKSEEKAEVIKNHTYSFLLETYIKVMTGMSVGEHHFELSNVNDLVDKSILSSLVDEHVKSVLNIIDPNKLLSNLTQGTNNNIGLSQNNKLNVGGIVFGNTLSNNPASSHVSLTPRLTSLSGLAGSINATSHVSTSKPTFQKFKVNSSIPTTSINNLPAKQVPVVLHSLGILSNFARSQSSLSDGLKLSKKLMTPRQFDRVFNVIVDPDEFEIDYDKTVETEFGKESMRSLIDRGDVISSSSDIRSMITKLNLPLSIQSIKSVNSNIRGNTSDVNNFKYRDRDRNEGDMMFEKYFITIESYDEE